MTIEMIQSWCKEHGKVIELTISDTEVYVTNYDTDGEPLVGWSQDEVEFPFIRGKGDTLGVAWAEFLTQMMEKDV